MSAVVIDNTFYSLISEPDVGSPIQRISKKLKYESQGGYSHQSDAFTRARRKFPLNWKMMSQSELNTLYAWMNTIGSDIFGFVDPTSMAPLADGSVVPVGYYCRISEDTMEATPKFCDGTEWYYDVSITFTEV